MNSIKNVLIVGGGIGGMCTAIELRKRGVSVDMVEQDKDWRVYGAGITISGAALRAFKSIGILQEIIDQGWCGDGCDICAPNGTVLVKLPTPRIAGPEVPGSGAILRPILARILSKATLASGTNVRLGVTFDSIQQHPTHVEVTCTDGTRAGYDLVIGADGLFSQVRATVFPEAPEPAYTGQGCWRAMTPRRADITNACMFMGNLTKAGVNPVSNDAMYLYCLENRTTSERIPEDRLTAALVKLLGEFSGPMGEIRDGLSAQSQILYRPLESVLLTPPWHVGRVVLIGDAAHATTPHLASGAAISAEDAIVLVEELARSVSVETALGAYAARRFDRCKMVVNNSLRLGQIEIESGSKDEHAQVMRDSMIALLAAI